MPKIKAFEFISPDKWRFLNNAEVEQAAGRAAEFLERQFYLDNLEQRIEEYLRQWILWQLTQVYGYPENWLWLTNASKRNANVVIKDESNRSIALVAARYFGDSDLDFEQAGHQLQSDLEEIETVRFGIVTDGRRIAFLCKNTDDQIGDYKTISDFPVFNELKEYLATNQTPKLPATTTQKFQKLPPPKPQAKLAASSAVNNQPQKKKQSFLSASRLKQASDRRTVAVVLGAVLLILLGAWYITKSEPIASGQSAEKTVVEREKSERTTVRTTAPSVLPDRPVSISNGRRQQQRAQSSLRQSAERELEPDGSIKLNREEISVMQSRPTIIAPSARNTQPQSASAPPLATAETQPNNRKIIRLPNGQ